MRLGYGTRYKVKAFMLFEEKNLRFRGNYSGKFFAFLLVKTSLRKNFLMKSAEWGGGIWARFNVCYKTCVPLVKIMRVITRA